MGRGKERRCEEERRQQPAPAKTKELQQRKAEEQRKIKEGRNNGDEGWLDVERRRRRYKEELEYKNKVTYFVSNLPVGCTWAGLWEAFKHHQNLMDTSVPSKKDKWGNTFGFLRFVDVLDKEAFMEVLKETKVDGRKIWITISKWRRQRKNDSSGTTVHIGKPPAFVCNHIPPTPPNFTNHNDGKKKHGSYRDTVAGTLQDTQLNVVKIIDGKSEVHPDAHPLKLISLIGTTHNITLLNNLKEYLNALNGLPGCSVRYLGGLTIVLTFLGENEAKYYLDQKENSWSKIFSSLKAWDGKPPPVVRVAWITITGVPPTYVIVESWIELVGPVVL